MNSYTIVMTVSPGILEKLQCYLVSAEPRYTYVWSFVKVWQSQCREIERGEENERK